MSTTDDSKRRQLLLREHKDQMAVAIVELCREYHIRALVGGGSVLTAQGIITPSVAPFLSVVVDPASNRHLIAGMEERGWIHLPASRRGILPPVKQVFSHPSWSAGLSLFTVIPGFFADPETTFDLLWERRREIPLRGTTIPGLDRLASAVLASHNSLDGRGPHASSHSPYFAEQFNAVLTPAERVDLRGLIFQLGAGAEMSAFLQSLGIQPVAFEMASDEYVKWRLKVTATNPQIGRAVAMLDLPSHGRRELRRSRSGHPRTIADMVTSVRLLPGTARAIFGARRRWARSG